MSAGATRALSDPGRDLGIDALRGLSIAAVVAYHYHKLWFPRGNYGVMLFFLISGYCIALSAETARGPWHFWSKRLGRLLPGLLACGALTVAAKQWIAVPPDRYADWSDYGAMLLALPSLNVARVDYRFPDGAYWSLVVEFQFYALVALLLVAGLRWRLVLGLLACQVLVLVVAVAGGGGVLPLLACHMPCFLAGAACLDLHRHGVARAPALGVAVAGLAMLLAPGLGLSDPSLPVDGGALLAFLASVGLLAVAGPAGRRIGGTWPMRALSGLGLVSYPLYLLHQDLGAILLAGYGTNFTDPAAVLARLVWVPALLAVLAWVVWRVVEVPARRPLTRLVASLPGAVDHLVGRLGGSALAARGVPVVVPRTLALMCAALLGASALRIAARADVDRAAGMVSGLLTAPSAAPAVLEQPWSGVVLSTLPDANIVDVRGVPYGACPELLERLQRLHGVMRIAVGTRADDERPVPMAALDREFACAWPGQRVVRLVAARPGVMGTATQ